MPNSQLPFTGPAGPAGPVASFVLVLTVVMIGLTCLRMFYLMAELRRLVIEHKELKGFAQNPEYLTTRAGHIELYYEKLDSFAFFITIVIGLWSVLIAIEHFEQLTTTYTILLVVWISWVVLYVDSKHQFSKPGIYFSMLNIPAVLFLSAMSVLLPYELRVEPIFMLIPAVWNFVKFCQGLPGSKWR